MGYNYDENDSIELNRENGYVYDEDLSMFYANSLDIQTSITDFMINFKQSTPNGFLDNKKIIMNPSLAKQLYKALSEAIDQYETVHHEIKDINTLQNEMDTYYDIEEQE
ncbi:DUF3467 domain-containing protein [Staphylococcus epidermidis]|uniref:DUF3467 domain-containing protein n=1 Tax=Staphylococcus epidermidis TaxID=1282 RepID=UPI0007363CC0|nr:DUF3467 domain-containing protein [Staphylococcus epidermidis]KTT58901.1 hypothetical protein SB7C_11440 [Staphylococcus epidermidis]KTT81648.1 hypothetical protein SA6_03215 [Staphylococcus epidermidis]KTW03128.1 hypothetical protein SA8_04985 [Staphylococcus epidermidis]KTW06986.1 hypothetical protein SB7B_03685 [Staphylococcus epidermidis]MCG2148486.1 DUF3467 domain-containing protein [Staphylococcus epidermidis]